MSLVAASLLGSVAILEPYAAAYANFDRIDVYRFSVNVPIGTGW